MVAMSSGVCNRCRLPINTESKTWCPPCHRIVVAEMNRRREHSPGCLAFVETPPGVAIHVGFVFIHETDEMIERLRTEPMGDVKPAKGSRIADPSGRVPRPIDGVAAKVTGIKE